jgi:predicted dehydrogenase
MSNLRFAVLGCGFWSQFQIAAWRELEGVELVAVYNRTRSKAQAIADRFGSPKVYDDAEAMLREVRPDFVDIITDVNTHERFVDLAALYRLPVICQKPMAPDLATARRMVATSRTAAVPFMVHENWRWQRPLRQFKTLLDQSGLGAPFRARITFSCSFPVFDNQPVLRKLERFILTDIGSHILDTARFLFGEASNLYCRVQRANPSIRGEDVATVMLGMESGATVTCEMSYASRLEHERFPETYVLAECQRGSIELGPDYWIRITDAEGTRSRRYPPPRYPWADPAYDLVQASIVDCNRDLLRALTTGAKAETDGQDNLRTVQLVFASYESAQSGHAITLNDSG